jgi:glutathione synthase/RimK-type ligase-like ATP-grasp enzyme
LNTESGNTEVGNTQALPRFVILGNPENRRVQMFVQELAERKQPEPVVLSYEDVLTNPERLDELPNEKLLFRQDSAGENANVRLQLLRLGYEDALDQGFPAVAPDAIRTIEHGEIYFPRQQHLGFCRLLSILEEKASQHANWQLLSPPSQVAELFDKRQTWNRWNAMGIPIPESLGTISSYEELAERAREQKCKAVYVKISCSSSASGLAIYRPGNPDSLMTTVEHTPEHYYNNLRPRRYTDGRVKEILDMLLAEGAQVERSAPKARLGGAFFDLRIVTIAGRPTFTVVRQSRHPITNLHLGGWRGEWSDLRTRLSDEGLAHIDASCARVAKAHQCHVLGIDVLIEPNWKTHRVIEANAFGDLLPGLERKGRSVYGYQIDALRGLL